MEAKRLSLFVPILLALATPSIAMAQASNTVYACKKGNGDYYVTSVGVAPSAAANNLCKNNETQVTWSITGPQGPLGPQGAAGSAGPAGPKGDTGYTGATGATGPAGPAGAAGPKGDTGATGAQGATGSTGPQGPQGLAGPAGTVGLQGPAGTPGPQGPAGVTNITTWTTDAAPQNVSFNAYQTIKTLALPQGNYLVLGKVNVVPTQFDLTGSDPGIVPHIVCQLYSQAQARFIDVGQTAVGPGIFGTTSMAGPLVVGPAGDLVDFACAAVAQVTSVPVKIYLPSFSAVQASQLTVLFR